MRYWPILLFVGLFGLIALFYRGLWGNPSFIPPVVIQTPARDFVAPELYKKTPIRLSQFKNKVVVLNFWASWCAECKLEHPALLKINEQFSSHPDFVMLGVNYQDKEELAKDYLQEHGNTFLHVRDMIGSISIDYGIYGVPETFVIDRLGIIRHKSIGPLIGQSYVTLVEKILPPLLRQN